MTSRADRLGGAWRGSSDGRKVGDGVDLVTRTEGRQVLDVVDVDVALAKFAIPCLEVEAADRARVTEPNEALPPVARVTLIPVHWDGLHCTVWVAFAWENLVGRWLIGRVASRTASVP